MQSVNLKILLMSGLKATMHIGKTQQPIIDRIKHDLTHGRTEAPSLL